MPVADARALADAGRPNAELRLVQGAGHRLRHDPRAIATLLGWLARQVPSGVPTDVASASLAGRSAPAPPSSTASRVSSRSCSGCQPVAVDQLGRVADEHGDVDRSHEIGGR